MLGNKDAAANIAVRNMKTARKFYEGTLGLKPVSAQGEELVALQEREFDDTRLPVGFRRNQQSHGADLDGGR